MCVYTYIEEEENSTAAMKKNEMYSNAMGSAAAGIVSRTFTHPLDTVSTDTRMVWGVMREDE